MTEDAKGERYNVGGGDSGLGVDDDLGGDDDQDDADEQDTSSTSSSRSDRDQNTGSSTTSHDTDSMESTSSTSSPDEIPHRVRHDSPKEERKEKTIVVDDDDVSRLDELHSLAKKEFDESVYLMDAYLAGLRAGLNSSDEKFLQEMREIGYGYFE